MEDLKNKKIGLFYLAHDGITSYYAGIGTFTRSYLGSFSEIIELLKKKGLNINLYLITPKYKKDFYGYNQKIKAESVFLAKKHGGKIIEVDNGMDGLDSYGKPENWDKCSKNAACEINKYLEKHKNNIIIAVDTPFLRVGEFLNKISEKRNFNVVLLPQSTERIHNSGILGRYSWERESFNSANLKKNIFVGYSSLYIKNHLITEYNIKPKKLIFSISGLNLGSERYKKYSQKIILKKMEEYGISTGRNLIFTVGRLEPYKGFVESIKFFNLIDKKFKPYLVIIGFSYIKNNPLISVLKEMKNKYKIDGKFIFELDLDLPILIWQWKNSKISLHLSQYEPFGLAPVEARLMAKSNGPVVVTSDRGGLKEQAVNKKEGFIVEYGTTKSYKNAIDEVFSMDKNKLKKMHSAAYKSVISKYDSSKNIVKLLSYLDKDIKNVYIKKRRNS